MSEMTYERWTAIWRNSWRKARHDHPTADLTRLHRQVNEAMLKEYGPCPDPPEKPPVKMRLGLWFLKKKLAGLPPVEVSMFVKKLVVSLCYGLGAAAPVVQVALADSVISGNEWGGIVSAGFVAFWGKFSSNTTVVAPSRKGETVAGPGQ